jgi:hypothetical protein
MEDITGHVSERDFDEDVQAGLAFCGDGHPVELRGADAVDEEALQDGRGGGTR